MSGLSLPCTLEEFKRATAEFTKAAPTADYESLENGWHGLGMLYIGLRQDHPVDCIIAKSYLEFAGRRFAERSLELAAAQPRG